MSERETSRPRDDLAHGLSPLGALSGSDVTAGGMWPKNDDVNCVHVVGTHSAYCITGGGIGQHWWRRGNGQDFILSVDGQ